MKSATVEQIQELDRLAIREIGIPSLALMENAGRAVAMEARQIVQKIKSPSVCVVCGVGHNAGDGFVAARYLKNLGCQVQILLIGSELRLKTDALINFYAARNLDVAILETEIFDDVIRDRLAQADVIVDAMFGVGLNRFIEDPYRRFIEGINDAGKPVVSVDIPSGLNGTTGEIFGVCVKAAVTVTFSLPKTGFQKKSGPHHAGKVVVADIGIPKSLIAKLDQS